MNILFGFTFGEEVMKQIKAEFANNGIDDSEFVQKNRKSSVEEYVYSNSDIDVLVLDEYLESTCPYTVEEITRLVEINEDMVVIPVIDIKHKCGDYVTGLYNTGVLNAVYTDTGIDEIAALIMKKRSRKLAKLYYGMSTQKEMQADERASIPSLISYIEEFNGDEEGTVEAFAYVRKRLSDQEFALLCDRLPDRYIELLWNRGLYGSYIGRRAEKTKKRISISIAPKLSFKSEEKKKIIYNAVANDIIAVVSANERAGCTYTALNLAKQIADMTGLVAGFLHLPDNGKTYTALGLGKIFPDYDSGFQTIYDGGSLSGTPNVIQRVSIMAENPDRDILDKWRQSDSLKALYQAPNPTVLDFGCMHGRDSELIASCKNLVCVIGPDDTVDDAVALRNMAAGLAEHMDCFFVLNNMESQKAQRIAGYLEGMGSITTLPFACARHGSFFAENSAFAELAGRLGYVSADKKRRLFAGKKGLFKKESRSIERRTGSTEIAVGGAVSGSGTTTLGIMVAAALAKRYRVAYLELNHSGHIGALSDFARHEIASEDVSAFPLNGVDFYYDISYEKFIMTARDNYDWVVIDYGTDVYNRDYIRAGKKIMTLFNAKWRMREIEELKRNIQNRLDASGGLVIAVPYSANKELAGIRKLFPDNQVIPVPYTNDPFAADNEAAAFAERIAGVVLKR